MKRFHLGLLPRIAIAIVLGVLLAGIMPTWGVRLFVTFNQIFSQFLGFLIPLIIVGLVTPAITDIGKQAGKMLFVTVALAYGMTILSGAFSYATSVWIFPQFIEPGALASALTEQDTLEPYISVHVPPIMDVMAALVLSFMLGASITATAADTMKNVFHELREVVVLAISQVMLPALPVYIFGTFLNIASNGQMRSVFAMFASIIGVIFAMHVLFILFQYSLAGAVTRRNPLRLLMRMMPAYFTALGTQSSAATIPVTIRQTLQNGVSHSTAGFVIPLCATIHLSGSMLKIVACAIALMLTKGQEVGLAQFFPFILVLAICMVAAPGVPGGAIIAALGVLASHLGFSESEQALMIALYIAMDCFGTAGNVTGDGALAIIIDQIFEPKRRTKR